MAIPVVNVQRAVPQYTERELWDKYFAITQELLKFIKQEDIDTFLDLVDQRQRLMEMLQAIPETEHHFGRSAEGLALKEKIKPLDMQIVYRARTWLNKSRRNNLAVRSYDIAGYEAAGNVFNKKY